MRSSIFAMLAAPALGGTPAWVFPKNGVPLSGIESKGACEAVGQRLCKYNELCPNGEDNNPQDMPSEHTDWMPFDDPAYGGVRWISAGCGIHELIYGPCTEECCGHGWCTTSGVDGCDSRKVEANGYSSSCKGTYACCGDTDLGTAEVGGEYFLEVRDGCGSGDFQYVDMRNFVKTGPVDDLLVLSFDEGSCQLFMTSCYPSPHTDPGAYYITSASRGCPGLDNGIQSHRTTGGKAECNIMWCACSCQPPARPLPGTRIFSTS